MSLLNWKKDETVAILTMTNGENRNNPEWTEAMLKAFDEMMADEDIKSIVITADDPKVFNLGVDLEWMMEKQKNKDIQAISDWLIRQNEVFRFAVMAPVPTIAAITGHAFGNGALLSLACDFRFMRSDRGYMCLPEVDLGIMFTPSMLEWVKKSMPYHLFIRMMMSGERISATELEKHNVIVEACADRDETLNKAVEFAKKFTKNRNTLKEMKVRLYKHISDKMDNEDIQYLKPPIDMFRV